MSQETGDILLDEVFDEIDRQDGVHPSGYFPPNRDNVRLCIASAEDELAEALEAWRDGRCRCRTPRCGHADWRKARRELIQTAAVILRGVRAIDRREG